MLVSASIQVISDILMFVLPQKIIWGLQMNWQNKLGVSIIFGVGILLVQLLLVSFFPGNQTDPTTVRRSQPVSGYPIQSPSPTKLTACT